MTDMYFDKINNVLINRLNILDSKELEKIEYQLVGYRMFQLQEMKDYSNLTMKNYKEIHRYLFQDVYEWAGKYREVEIYKENTAFLPHQFFDNAEQDINKSIKLFIFNSEKTEDSVFGELSEILCSLNYMHPFREGNGRTQREFVRQLAYNKGYELDISNENELYMEACIKDDSKLMYQALKMYIKKI